MLKLDSLQPLADFVLIRPDPEQAKTVSDGGVLLPDVVQGQVIPRTGAVIAVGVDATRIKVGDHVLFSAHAGSPIELNGADCLLMLERAVAAIVTPRSWEVN